MKLYWIVYSSCSYLPDCVSYFSSLFLTFLVLFVSSMIYSSTHYVLPALTVLFSLCCLNYSYLFVVVWVVVLCRFWNRSISQLACFSPEDGGIIFLSRYSPTRSHGNKTWQPESNYCHEISKIVFRYDINFYSGGKIERSVLGYPGIVVRFLLRERYTVFQNEFWTFGSLYEFIQRTCTVFWTVIM
jgi:hypothetical protein